MSCQCLPARQSGSWKGRKTNTPKPGRAGVQFHILFPGNNILFSQGVCPPLRQRLPWRQGQPRGYIQGVWNEGQQRHQNSNKTTTDLEEQTELHNHSTRSGAVCPAPGAAGGGHRALQRAVRRAGQRGRLVTDHFLLDSVPRGSPTLWPGAAWSPQRSLETTPCSTVFHRPLQHGLHSNLSALERKRREIKDELHVPPLASLLPPSIPSPALQRENRSDHVTLLKARRSSLPPEYEQSQGPSSGLSGPQDLPPAPAPSCPHLLSRSLTRL